MNFALLGDDPAVLPIVRVIAADPSHGLSWAAHVGRIEADVLRHAPDVQIAEDWPDLAGCDAVIVCGDGDAALDGGRRLATEGLPLLLVPHPGQGSSLVYELTLIRDESHGLLQPAFPLRHHPAIATMKRRLAAGAVGRVLHLQLERVLCGDDATTSLLSTRQINGALLFDADVLRHLGGDYERVTASRSGEAGGKFSVATTTLAGEDLPTALWTVRAGSVERRETRDERREPEKPGSGLSTLRSGLSSDPATQHWQLTAVGERGRIVVSGGEDLSQWHWQGEGDAAGDAPAVVAFEPGRAALGPFEAALRNESVRPDWTDLTRAVEILDAARQSLRRRRTIDLHFETASERSQFKTQMTALGCGVLVLTLLAVVAVLVAGALFPVPRPVMWYLRLAAFAPLAVFLVLQLLVFIARPSSTPRETGDSTPVL